MLVDWFRLHEKMVLQNALFVSTSPPEFDIDIHRDNVSIGPSTSDERLLIDVTGIHACDRDENATFLSV
jgi:hypothetical protein